MLVFLPDFALKPAKTLVVEVKRSRTRSTQREYSNNYVSSPKKNDDRRVESSEAFRRKIYHVQSKKCFENQTLDLGSFFSHESCNINNARKRDKRDFPIHSRKGIRFVSHVLNKSKKMGHEGLTTMPTKNSSSYSQSPFLVARKVRESERKRPETYDNSKLEGSSFFVRRFVERERLTPSSKNNFRQKKVNQIHDYRPWSPSRMLDLDQQHYNH